MIKARDERGIVSVMTVLFFVVLLSVLVVAFLRIMSDEQEQGIGDDLTKGALASAQSGVEDAKRALLFCKGASGLDKAQCDAALNVTTCPGIFANPVLRAQLGVSTASDGTVQVGGDTAFNQRYTCLLISRQTDDVKGVTRSDEGFANMIELGTNGATFNEVKISWHRNGDKYDGPSVAIPASGSVDIENPQQSSWRGPSPTFTPYPALLRVQLLEYDPAATVDQLSERQLTYFLMPATGGSASSTMSIAGPINNTITPQSGSVLKRLTFCSDISSLEYACSMRMQNITGITPATGKRYFMRISSVYRTTNYKIELFNSGVAVPFFDVQPEIDSTGVADNTYRRVVTRVEYGQDGYYPDNGVATGDMLCKGFYVTISGNGGTTGGANCTNGLASP